MTTYVTWNFAENPGRFSLIDHIKKIVDVVDLNEDNKPKNAREMLDRPEIHRVNLKTNDVTFTPVKGWFGGERTETVSCTFLAGKSDRWQVAGFETKVYDVHGLDMVVTKRTRSKEIKLPPPDLPPKYFQEGVKEGKGEGELYMSTILTDYNEVLKCVQDWFIRLRQSKCQTKVLRVKSTCLTSSRTTSSEFT